MRTLLLVTFLCTGGGPLFLFSSLAGVAGATSSPRTCVLAKDLTFFRAFTDHAVLQRDVEHPVWGWAAPEAQVTLSFGENELTARSDADGRWEVRLPAQEAGGPHTLALQSGDERIAIEDVYFGDVYLLSGQSNMEWRLEQSDLDGSRATAIADPLIRELKVEKQHANTVQKRLPLDPTYGEAWMVGSADRMGSFSGVGSYFAHYLRREADVPIGLLHSSWGGSRIEAWMTAEALGLGADEAAALQEDAAAAAGGEARESFTRNFPGRELPKIDEGESLGWLRDEFDDSDWPSMTLPTQWEVAGWPAVDGHFYFRGSFTLTAEQAAEAATLYLGAVDDGDFTYINGKLVGSIPDAYSTERKYDIEPAVLREGENTLAIRVYDGMGGGGFSAKPEAFYLATAAGNVSLGGEYRYNIGEFRIDVAPNQLPTVLYNAMIAPLENLPLAGVLWYQGESNSGHADNVAYAEQMKSLIRQWRGHFSHPDVLPFYWVQLANFMAPVAGPDEPGWAVLRQSQTEALSEPMTGMAVITDVGDADDIHPKNKWEVGRRLSLFALRDVYGRKVQADSPSVADVKLVDGKAEVAFMDAPNGLVAKAEGRNSSVTGFTVQGENGEWHFAPAVLSLPNKVLVSHPEGGGITRVRYNWASNPNGNLYSTEGLPVNAFDRALPSR